MGEEHNFSSLVKPLPTIFFFLPDLPFSHPLLLFFVATFSFPYHIMQKVALNHLTHAFSTKQPFLPHQQKELVK